MNSLKTLIYMGSLHGFFTFYVPFLLAGLGPVLLHAGRLRFLALPLWTIGAWFIIRCSTDMVRRGRGTPAHMDPPLELVMTGLYRHVRNPIYLGALLAQLGHIFWSGSALVIVYFFCYVIAFHILIMVFEEPVLGEKFGRQYDEYRRSVPRWFPRFK
jgi:protein-S-isoprenylcysteine O-methyltransferase Ste14